MSEDNLQELFGNIDIYLFDQLLKGRFAPGLRVLTGPVGRHWRIALQIARVRQLVPRHQRRGGAQPNAVLPAAAGAPDRVAVRVPRAGAGAVLSGAIVAARVAPAGLPAVVTVAAARAVVTD